MNQSLIVNDVDLSLEARYLLMRFVRLMFFPVFMVATGFFIYYTILLLLLTPDIISRFIEHNMMGNCTKDCVGMVYSTQLNEQSKAGLYFIFWIVSLVMVIIGVSGWTSYLYTSNMPTAKIYSCGKCKNPIAVTRSLLCPVCGGIFPLGIGMVIIRLLNICITTINIILSIIIFFITFGKRR